MELGNEVGLREEFRAHRFWVRWAKCECRSNGGTDEHGSDNHPDPCSPRAGTGRLKSELDVFAARELEGTTNDDFSADAKACFMDAHFNVVSAHG